MLWNSVGGKIYDVVILAHQALKAAVSAQGGEHNLLAKSAVGAKIQTVVACERRTVDRGSARLQSSLRQLLGVSPSKTDCSKTMVCIGTPRDWPILLSKKYRNTVSRLTCNKADLYGTVQQILSISHVRFYVARSGAPKPQEKEIKNGGKGKHCFSHELAGRKNLCLRVGILPALTSFRR